MFFFDAAIKKICDVRVLFSFRKPVVVNGKAGPNLCDALTTTPACFDVETRP